MKITELQTPAILVNMDYMEHNLKNIVIWPENIKTNMAHDKNSQEYRIS